MHGKYSEGAGAQIQLHFAGGIPVQGYSIDFDTVQINLPLKLFTGVYFEQALFSSQHIL